MKFILLCCIMLVFVSCNNNQIKLNNNKKGKMHASMELNLIETKLFSLDNTTAPKPIYVQIIKDSLGVRQLTFLNDYNNSIYFYDYEKLNFLMKITFDENGPDGVQKPMGYYIKSMDSIYIYSRLSKVLLANSNGKVLKTISLIGNHDMSKSVDLWRFSYPEFYVETITPFMETSEELLLTGQYEGFMHDSLLGKAKFTAHIDFNLNSINYSHTYPHEIFGNNINWGDGLFKEVFPQVHPDGSKIIYSFPESHDLFITDINTNNYKRVYAGSNFAGTISSIDKKPGKESAELVRSKFVKQDMYAAIIYDKFRKVYYRFMRKAIPDASVNTSWKDKKIAIIIMDIDFNYLGETILGTEREWHWQNSFVTTEGLNIEYLEENDIDEVNLNLKIFIPKKI